MCLLFEFLAKHRATDPTQVTVQQVDASLIREFLCHLEDRRGNCVATRNRRLAAVRSLFRFIGRLDPELVDHAAQVCAIPDRKAPIPVIPYLSRPEVEALLAIPDRGTDQGRRDYCILLLRYNTGARASEAAGLTIADLNLVGSPCVRFLGKGRKHRLCPLWPRTVEILRQTIGARLDGLPEAPVFLSQRCQRLTRFGVYELVTRVAREQASQSSYLETQHGSPLAASRGRHQHDPGLARSRLSRNHEPLRRSRLGNQGPRPANVLRKPVPTVRSDPCELAP